MWHYVMLYHYMDYVPQLRASDNVWLYVSVWVESDRRCVASRTILISNWSSWVLARRVKTTFHHLKAWLPLHSPLLSAGISFWDLRLETLSNGRFGSPLLYSGKVAQACYGREMVQPLITSLTMYIVRCKLWQFLGPTGSHPNSHIFFWALW